MCVYLDKRYYLYIHSHNQITNMKLLTIFILGICTSFYISAQSSLELFTVSGRYGFPQEYESTYTGKAMETGVLVNLQFPIPFSKSTIWYSQLTNTTFWVNNDNNMPADIANPIMIPGFILQTGLYKKFSNGRGMQLLFAPRL